MRDKHATVVNKLWDFMLKHSRRISPFAPASGVQVVAAMGATDGAISILTTFSAKGYLVEQVGPDIGKETFVAGSTITTTP
jgi:hypothetical protein